MTDLVVRENRDGAAILTLNRPDKLNALSAAMFEALDDHLHRIARETRMALRNWGPPITLIPTAST